MSNIRLSELIAPHFYELHRDIKAHKHSEYVLKGGRGSTKSSEISLEVIMLIMKNPLMHALVCRQVGNTLRDSVYAQLIWAINVLGVAKYFKTFVAPLSITYKPTGQTIYFRGADDPYKIKSIKAPFGYIGILWFEELDTFKGAETVRSIEQSAKRGGDMFYTFKSFNPPITTANWANQYVLNPKPSALIHHSTFLDVPRDWLGEDFFSDAEYLQEQNERAYRHEYLGEPVGNGGSVFENVEIKEITDDEISQFDRIYMGLDWGWYPDPFQWTKMYFDMARRALYIFDEYRTNKTSNENTAKYLMEHKGVTAADEIGADSAEQKSVSDYKGYGLIRTYAAEKGPGSVEYSMKWLQSLNAIIIDGKRCPETAKEFVSYEYERSKDGEIISGYPDKDNHAIDSVRYGLNRLWKRRAK